MGESNNTENKKNSKLLQQILKFGVVGGLSFVIDFVIYTIVIKILDGQYAYLIGGVLGFAISLVFNYFASMAFVFERKEDADRKKEFVVFMVLSLIGMGLNTLLLWLYVDVMCGNVAWIYDVHSFFFDLLTDINLKIFPDVSEFIEIMAKLFATAIVMVYNFVTRKKFIEKKD